MRIYFESREELSPDIWQYHFRPEQPLEYEPGQYVDVHIVTPLIDARGPMRTFTLTSIPSDPTICFTARFLEPLSGYKRALQALSPGDELRVDDTMGDGILPKSPYTPLIFIAGGLGIASYVSILRQLLRSGQNRSIQLFYSRHTDGDNPYAALLQQFPFTTFQQYVSPAHLKLPIVLRAITSDSLVYLSGSETFVEELRKTLTVNGVEHEQIIFDFFDGYSSL